MNLALPIFLPILWAIVATVIALVLYKTSKALFESNDIPQLSAKRMRLTGSVVIAALAFLGMKWATPDSLLEAADAHSKLIPRQLLLDQLDAVKDTESALVELSACAEMGGSFLACTDQLRIARNSARRARERATLIGE